MNPLAKSLVEQLRQRNQRLVLVESCTCGMVAAAIGGVPGASNVFCGSSVTYRETTKKDWLGIESDTLVRYSAESEQTSEALARAVLQRTPEATIAAAITGHLGPDAPPEKDGIVFACIANRSIGPDDPCTAVIRCQQFQLQSTDRSSRQREATDWLLQLIAARAISMPPISTLPQ